MAVKYIIEQTELTVRVSHHPVEISWPVFKPELTESQAAEISDYVEQHQLGRRVAYDMWKLKNSQAMTLFMLHYG